jgi:hypothetical protein
VLTAIVYRLLKINAVAGVTVTLLESALQTKLSRFPEQAAGLVAFTCCCLPLVNNRTVFDPRLVWKNMSLLAGATPTPF